ncbi:MAG: chemotaxis protein CheD, partial [Candidatus Heimdallarchaeota archaeon]|nr:chemotaxis protein CheD [Candidatus Heimdallarchaeota archaeon]
METFPVRIGDIVVTQNPNKLEALGVGSCIILVIYDEITKIAGMAHILLPETIKSDNGPPGKYADSAVIELIRQVVIKGGNRNRLKSKMVGGARMFELSSQTEGILDVGKRNAIAVKLWLEKNGIPLVAEDI